LCRFTQLHSLNLSSNNLSSFPLAVLELVNLVELNLGGNHLSDIPTGIDQLNRSTFLLLFWYSAASGNSASCHVC